MMPFNVEVRAPGGQNILCVKRDFFIFFHIRFLSRSV